MLQLKFVVNSHSTSIQGTSHKGYIKTTYKELLSFFGQPKSGSADNKTTCEWHLEFDDGTVTTIYDWKTGKTPTELYNWHVGGRTSKALTYLNQVFNAPVIHADY